MKSDKIHVLETRNEIRHQDAISMLEECLDRAKKNPSIHTVVICMEDKAKNLGIYWSSSEDRAWIGSRLILAGMKRLGFTTVG
jgi:hypothetical protein